MTLSQQIESDLRTHTALGTKPPYRLTLQAMAAHFDASIQPVRTAVDHLLEQHWLLRNADGLALNPQKKGRIAPSPRHALRPDLHALLSERIIQHSLRGEKVFLREEETAAQFKVGRSVLRAALNRLTGDGLLEHIPRRGWRVRAYSEAQMLDYLEVRETLELRALDLASNRLDTEQLKRMAKANTPTLRDPLRIDNQLHAYWIECADNRYITDFFAQHGRYYTALFDYASLAGSIVAEMAAQHRAILEALLQGEQAKARRVLRQHIRSQRPNVVRLMDRLPANQIL